MAKNFIEFNSYDADTVSYSNYDSTKTVLGNDIYKFSATNTYDYYISPNITSFRDITQDSGISNWGDIDAITYNGNKQWIFCLKGFAATNTTTDIAMYEFDKSNYSYTYKGEIRCSGADISARTHQGIKANLEYYSAGTVTVNGTSVSGTNTNWIEGRIPIGARIGFGSTNPENITTWYRITDYPLMNNLPSKTNAAINCVAVDSSNGKIYIGGNFTTYNGVTRNRIARLNSDGTLDTSFNPGTGFDSQVFVITLDSVGKLYVGGAFTTYSGVAANRIIKLNTDGTKDTSFDNTTGFNSEVWDIKLDSLGQIWVSGVFTTWKGVSAPYITKLNTDGSRDVTYPNTANPNSFVRTISIANNNDVYIGGDFTTVSGVSRPYIAKIFKTGGTDSTFVVGAGFNNPVYSIYYKSATNSIIVGGIFATWKGVANINLTELSSSGDTIISSASNVNISNLLADNLGNIYTYGASQIVSKRNINTLLTDPNFTPNIVYVSHSISSPVTGAQVFGSNKAFALNPTNDRLYAVSSNLTIDSGIVCVETTGGTRDVNFLTSQDWKSQSITINTSAGTLPPGTPYVIEDLKIISLRSVTGTHLIQGISVDDFTISPTSIVAPAFNFMGLSKGRYNIQDATYSTANGFSSTNSTAGAKDLRILDKENSNTQYLYAVLNTGNVTRFNVKASYITQIGLNSTGILRYATTEQLLVTGAGIINITGAAIAGFASGKFTIATMQSGSASGVTSIYLDNTGIIQTPLNQLTNGSQPIYNYMPEQPPGSTSTYNAAGNVGRVYYMPTIDRLIVLNSSSTAKSFITKFSPNLQQPTLVSTLYGRDTYNTLAYENSYDTTFLMNGNQLQGNTASIFSQRYPDTLGTGFFGAIENGVLHLCRPLNSIQNNLYAVPIGCESLYVDYSKNALYTPKYVLPNAVGITGLYVNQFKEYGSSGFTIPPEILIIHYRTTGIDTDTGSWTEFTNVQNLNDDIICEGFLNSVEIQFRFSYRIAGNTCLPNRVYGFTLVYEDDRTDSHYSPSVSNSNLINRTFAWRQESLWNSNIPNLKIRLYNATNNNIVFYDTITNSASGSWEYSTDNGVTWLPWNSSADSVGNYIRYVADFIPSGIKLRVGLNTI